MNPEYWDDNDCKHQAIDDDEEIEDDDDDDEEDGETTVDQLI